MCLSSSYLARLRQPCYLHRQDDVMDLESICQGARQKPCFCSDHVVVLRTVELKLRCKIAASRRDHARTTLAPKVSVNILQPPTLLRISIRLSRHSNEHTHQSSSNVVTSTDKTLTLASFKARIDLLGLVLQRSRTYNTCICPLARVVVERCGPLTD